MMEEYDTCPRCNTNKKNKPLLKLMINVCGHTLCETCVEQLFFRGSGVCPNSKCGRLLKKSEFRLQEFEDNYIEKEVSIRKKVMKDLIREEADFPSLREFNDYLETVESLIFNLANNIDEEESNKKLEELKKEAKESAKNRSRIKLDIKRENPLFTYKPTTFYNHGPNMPSIQDILENYVPNIRTDRTTLACGFPPHIPVRRTLQDSFSDLFYTVRAYPA